MAAKVAAPAFEEEVVVAAPLAPLAEEVAVAVVLAELVVAALSVKLVGLR